MCTTGDKMSNELMTTEELQRESLIELVDRLNDELARTVATLDNEGLEDTKADGASYSAEHRLDVLYDKLQNGIAKTETVHQRVRVIMRAL